MKICVMGTPVNSGNLGVSALGGSVINLCSAAAGHSRITLLLNHRDNTPAEFRIGGEPRPIPLVNVRMSPRAARRDHLLWIIFAALLYRLLPVARIRAALARSTPWIQAVAEADLVGGIHGGDSFSDIYGLKGLGLTFLMDWTVLLVKGSMVQFPQTYGPYKSTVARGLARYLLRNSSVIIARDKDSQKVAQDLVGPAREILLSPDVAFSLDSIVPAQIALDPPLAGPVPAGIIGLNVSGLLYNGGYSRNNMFGLKLEYVAFVSHLAESLLRAHPGELWLVPHTFAPDGHVESDPEASRRVRDALPPELRARVRIVNRNYDQYEIKGVIRQCDFFVGSRMHACIAALSQGVPCVGVAYSMKFRGVFESVGMADWVVDGREATGEQAVARILELYRQRTEVRPGLQARAEDARARLKDVFRQLIESARGKPPAQPLSA